MIEVMIVAALVLWSTVVVFKKVFPQTSNSVFLKMSQACEARGWISLAKWLKPKMAMGCGGNCACPASEDKQAKAAPQQTVKWK